MDQAQSGIPYKLREQAEWCRKLGSPLYTALLIQAAEDVEAGGPCWLALQGHENDGEGGFALGLRFLGAVHRLVLEGKAPELALYYPSMNGTSGAEQVWPVFRRSVERHLSELRDLAGCPVQTNEVARSCAMVGGFLLIASETGLPLRLLEIGASAGLNLRWDHYWYQAGASEWGDAASPVRFENAFSESRPPFEVSAQVVERRGCDRNPLDPNSPDTELTLRSYVWPDQVARHERLRAALVIARRVPARLDKAGAADWLTSQLVGATPRAVTVVFHSIVIPYLSVDERDRVCELLREAGDRATAEAPFAWLRMEPAGEQADVRLTLWPGGEERLIATAAYHGPPIRWLIR
jgi:hypothetical protein